MVKLSVTGHGGLKDIEAPIFSRNSVHRCGEAVSLKPQPLTPRMIPDTLFC
jgi:hypothetical protein